MSQHEAALRNYLLKYKHPNETKLDIINTVTQYRDLRPSFDPFVFNDGTHRQLVQLDGTIPVNYKGNVYNIPITIWILDTHPHNPPMVFIKPTSTMQIKPGRYVDANGKVEMPYVREWRHPTSHLLGLVRILTATFGEECPVFSRASGPIRPPGITFPSQPPYTANQGGMPMPAMSYPASSGSGGPGYPSASYPAYPSSGSYPNIGNPPYPSYSQPVQNSGYPPPYPSNTANPPYPSSQPQRPSGYTAPSGSYPSSQFNSHLPYQSVVNNVGAGERPQFIPGGTVTEADLRASLLSAVEDKMRRRMRETFAQAQAEMDVLSKTQKDLSDGKQKLEKIVSDLEKEKVEISKNIQMLQEKDKEVKDAIKKMEGQQDLDIDDAVITTTPLYRQLVDAFAEEQAIEDAIYYLGEALRKNVIELESFLKRVRELSRKQFMLRATIQKCREKAGLPPLA
uniref:UEV domain-containing protein n=1 Tax=Arion vulgaris TaxID=1028688 RepID=A0A0B7A2X0_9EUPU